VNQEADHSCWMDETPQHLDEFQRCQDLATEDLLPPDGVPLVQTRTCGVSQFMATTSAITPQHI
jgi:hypothetical protein